MSDETQPQDSAAMSPASAGSQPVAWAVMLSSGCTWGLCQDKWEATAICEAMKTHDISHARIVPLYRQHTLTDEEREAIWFFAAIDSNESTLGKYAATLRSLLERLSPPAT